MAALEARPRRGRLADQAGLLSLGNAIALLLQLGVGIVLARLWPRETYGSFLQVTLLVATLSPILFLGIPSSLYYFLPREDGERRGRLVLQSVGLLALLGILGAAGMVLAAPALAGALNNEALAPAVRRYAPALAGMLPAAVAHPLLVSLQRYGAATLVVSGVALGDAVLTVGAVLAGAGLEALVTALAGLHVVVGAGVALFAARVAASGGQGVPRRLDPGLFREQLRYAVPFATSIHVGTLARFFDRYLIGALFAPGVFAVYAVGAREMPVVPLVLSSVTIVLQQRFTALHREGRTAEIPGTWRGLIRQQALLVLPLAALLFLLAEPFITLLYSDRYLDSVPVFRAYLGLLVLRAAAWPIVLVALGRTRTVLAGSLLALAAGMAVSLALVRPLGLLGPALGAVAGPLAAAAFYLAQTQTLLGTSWRRLVPWPVLGRIAASAGAAGLALAPLAARVDGPLVALGLAAAYVALFSVLARATGALLPGDLAFVGRWLRNATACVPWLRCSDGQRPARP